jgi:hypothetical protein
VTHLRQLMIVELKRRNFAESTIRSYVQGVEHFSWYFHRRPDRLGNTSVCRGGAPDTAQRLRGRIRDKHFVNGSSSSS